MNTASAPPTLYAQHKGERLAVMTIEQIDESDPTPEEVNAAIYSLGSFARITGAPQMDLGRLLGACDVRFDGELNGYRFSYTADVLEWIQAPERQALRIAITSPITAHLDP